MNETVNSFFLNLYIIKILDRFIKIMHENFFKKFTHFMCKIFKEFFSNCTIYSLLILGFMETYRFMCKIFKEIIFLKFAVYSL